MRSRVILLACVLSAACYGSAAGQQRLTSFLVRPAPDPPSSFLSAVPDSQQVSGTTVQPPLPKSKSGKLAMLLSAVLPGAGQVYAERYYTIPVIWGLGGYFASQWFKSNDRYKDYQRRYTASIDSINTTGDKWLHDVRDFYHDQRDQFAIYLGLTYLLNIVDAYVGAALYGFDVSDNLGGSSQIRFRIPIR